MFTGVVGNLGNERCSYICTVHALAAMSQAPIKPERYKSPPQWVAVTSAIH